MEKRPEKPGKRQELEDNLARARQLTIAQQARIEQLEQENKHLLQAQGLVSQEEYDGLLKQLERERLLKEQYQRLYEQEAKKRKEVSECLKTQHETIAAYKKKLNELETKLSRKGTGKPRNNQTTDEEVLTLRNTGKKIREICSITTLSPTTVNKILKNAPPH